MYDGYGLPINELFVRGPVVRGFPLNKCRVALGSGLDSICQDYPPPWLTAFGLRLIFSLICLQLYFFASIITSKSIAMASDKHDKKRKRDSDRHERPSKKPALDLQRLPPLTAKVVDDHSELAPVIGMLPITTVKLSWMYIDQ